MSEIIKLIIFLNLPLLIILLYHSFLLLEYTTETQVKKYSKRKINQNVNNFLKSGIILWLLNLTLSILYLLRILNLRGVI